MFTTPSTGLKCDVKNVKNMIMGEESRDSTDTWE